MAAAAGVTKSAILGQMVKGVTIPWKAVIGKGINTEFDYARESDLPELVKLFSAMSSLGDGLDSGQLQSEQVIRRYLSSGASMTARDLDQDRTLYGFTNIVDSPISRSSRPRGHAGYVIVTPDYKGKNVAKQFTQYFTNIGIQMGYNSVVGRTTLYTTGLFRSMKKTNCLFPGTILDSGYHGDQVGWVDDVITYTDYTAPAFFEFTGKTVENLNPYPPSQIPPLIPESHSPAETRNTIIQEEIDKAIASLPTPSRIKLVAVGEDNLILDKMIRDSAEDGHGFGLDEFNDRGRYNRKLFHTCVTLLVQSLDGDAAATAAASPSSDFDLARNGSPPSDLSSNDTATPGDPTGTVVGGVVLGDSALCRTTQRRNMGLQIVVDKAHRRKGYAQDVYQICEDMALKMGYTNITSDVVAGDPAGLRLAMNNGFTITGQVPNSVYAKGRGQVGCLVLYKRLTQKAQAHL